MDLKVIKIQYAWRCYKNCKLLSLLVKNRQLLRNHIDPISNEDIYDGTRILLDANDLYPIKRSNNVYLYNISSLKLLIDNNENEIFTKKQFTEDEKKEFDFYLKYFNYQLDEDKQNDKEKKFLLKTKIFKTFYDLETYFTVTLYDKLNENELYKIFTEVKLMWEAFKEDNNINDKDLFGKDLNWMYSNEDDLLNNIDIMINNELDKLFRKNICYIIIGAFSYVNKDIKKIYRNIDFI